MAILRVFLFVFLLPLALFAHEGKFLLLLGPSGAGKSTIIKHLQKIDDRFVYITPYTTRELRVGEKDKVHVDLPTILQMEEEGKLLTVNKIYDIYYATPKEMIDNALVQGKFPVLDWPVDKIDVMLKNYEGRLFTVYIALDSLDELEKRLAIDGRDPEGKRFHAGKTELENYRLGLYDSVINFKVVNRAGEDEMLSEIIYRNFLQ